MTMNYKYIKIRMINISVWLCLFIMTEIFLKFTKGLVYMEKGIIYYEDNIEGNYGNNDSAIFVCGIIFPVIVIAFNFIRLNKQISFLDTFINFFFLILIILSFLTIERTSFSLTIIESGNYALLFWLITLIIIFANSLYFIRLQRQNKA